MQSVSSFNLLVRNIFIISIVAESLLQQLNPNIDPCEDFYRFVCDRYIENNVIREDDTSKSTKTDLRDSKLRQLGSKSQLSMCMCAMLNNLRL